MSRAALPCLPSSRSPLWLASPGRSAGCRADTAGDCCGSACYCRINRASSHPSGVVELADAPVEEAYQSKRLCPSAGRSRTRLASLPPVNLLRSAIEKLALARAEIDHEPFAVLVARGQVEHFALGVTPAGEDGLIRHQVPPLRPLRALEDLLQDPHLDARRGIMAAFFHVGRTRQLSLCP